MTSAGIQHAGVIGDDPQQIYLYTVFIFICVQNYRCIYIYMLLITVYQATFLYISFLFLKNFNYRIILQAQFQALSDTVSQKDDLTHMKYNM